jgi:hypothetical protein
VIFRLTRRWTLAVPAAAFVVLLVSAVPALANSKPFPLIRTSTTMRGLAWADMTFQPRWAGAGTQFGADVGPFTVTTDHGTSWLAAQSDEVVVGTDPQVHLAVENTPNGLISGVLIMSSDSGVSWRENTSFTALLVSLLRGGYGVVGELIPDPARPGVVYATVRVGDKALKKLVLESTDGGLSWSAWPTPLIDYSDGGFGAEAIPGRDAFLVADVGNGTTRDGSALVQALAVVTPAGKHFVFRRPVKVSVGDQARLTWTGRLDVDGSGSRVLLQTTKGWMLSTDGGAHLHALGLARAVSPTFDPSGAGRLYALRGGTVYHSHDSGEHWTRRGHANGASRLAVDLGGRLVYAFGVGGTWISRDGGAGFKRIHPFTR